MNILLTSTRAPVTLELIRAFGRSGHTVVATDTQRWTLGSHSRYVASHVVTPPPRQAPAAFLDALERLIVERRIDWLIPTCEEVFYVARGYERLSARTRVFTSPLAVLAELHHKFRFGQRASALGLRTPRTVLIASRDELMARLPEFPAYVLKPAYSRFATQVISNCGPHAGQIALSSCDPTPEQPWLLQDFIAGPSVCSYSALHDGHVTAHCAYAIPHTFGGGSGVQFRSIDGMETLAIVERLGAALRYTGQISLDFIRGDDGLYLLECNPRATSGAHLIDSEQLIGGLTDPTQPTFVTPPGRCRQLTIPLLAGAGRQLRRWPGVLRAALTHDDVIADLRDPLPLLTQLPMTLRFAWIARREQRSLTAATTYDIEWNGVP
ncbi:MAG: ATP-grasp domain-containing protein [Chloroflexi bacterium]|nr:ATP-grasp domain-containing protein [Chloroflexota bacterium]